MKRTIITVLMTFFLVACNDGAYERGLREGREAAERGQQGGASLVDVSTDETPDATPAEDTVPQVTVTQASFDKEEQPGGIDCARLTLGCPEGEQCRRPHPGTPQSVTDSFYEETLAQLCPGGRFSSVRAGHGTMSDGQEVDWTAVER